MLLVSNFSGQNSVSGIRKITQNEKELYEYCDLSDVDNMILSHSSLGRRLEILNVRALIKELGLNIKIHYKDRKPICDDGFISISHSDDLACVIWSRDTEYSVDIEKISSRMLRISNRAFSDEELSFAGKDLRKMTILWNCKECVYKLANSKGINFKQQIQVLPFSENGKIICNYFCDSNCQKTYKFDYKQVLDHTYVWGKQIIANDTKG
ncbi:MAG: 4'-phosphopantetheinyl transferase superfamily protein [Bacteroidales bacterium]|nr:4'-phosphopantetheinyl transferase superfamily protein [Bacteroidales bacterium]